MKPRLLLGVGAVVGMLALSAIGSTGSAFAFCGRVPPGHASNFVRSTPGGAFCEVGPLLLFGAYSEFTTVGKHDGQYECSEVSSTENGEYEDNKCEKVKEGKGGFALIQFLPAFSVETKFKGTSGKGKLNLTGAEIKCESGTNEGSATSTQLGTFTIDFKSCSLGGKECHSEGDTEGIILVKGEYHLVRLGAEKAGIWFLVNEVKITCKFLSTKTAVKGNVLGKIEPVNSKTTSFTLPVNVVEGKQEVTEFENNEGVKEKAKLEGSVNGGAFKAATEESAENKITTEKETEVVVSQ